MNPIIMTSVYVTPCL